MRTIRQRVGSESWGWGWGREVGSMGAGVDASIGVGVGTGSVDEVTVKIAKLILDPQGRGIGIFVGILLGVCLHRVNINHGCAGEEKERFGKMGLEEVVVGLEGGFR